MASVRRRGGKRVVQTEQELFREALGRFWWQVCAETKAALKPEKKRAAKRISRRNETKDRLLDRGAL